MLIYSLNGQRYCLGGRQVDKVATEGLTVLPQSVSIGVTDTFSISVVAYFPVGVKGYLFAKVSGTNCWRAVALTLAF